MTRVRFRKTTLFLQLLFGLFFIQSNCYGQFGLGVRAGGNLSGGNGNVFGSRRIGYSIGGDLMYGFNKNISLQLEPTYNLTRLKINSSTQDNQKGLYSGTRALKYLSTPLHLKINFTKGLALLGGADFNWLINDDSYFLNNGYPAFRSRTRIGYSIGGEIGSLYFRYKKFSRNNNIVENWSAIIDQYQLGFKVKLF